jgi:hypothetical protein
MRRSRETSIIRDDNGVVIGVTMKADFTAEHEWGIKDLKNTLGVNDTKLGIKGRIINNCGRLFYFKTNKGAYLCVPGYFDPKPENLDKEGELHGWRETLSSAWSGQDMYIYAKGEKDVLALEEIYKQAQKKNVAIGLGGADPRNPFDRAGLNIMIVSNMPKDVLQKIYDDDLDYQNLQKADKKTKLKEAINAKYKDTWKKPSIRAGWANGHSATREGKPIAEATKYAVVYWLNAGDYYGWYTVEEIREWLKTDKGIIASEKNKKHASV